MKNLMYILTALLFMLSSNAFSQMSHDKEDNSKKQAEIIFEKKVHDFGTIVRGSDGTFDFVFKNTGKAPLILNNVRSSCGCTVPTWPHDPIKKRKKGSIRVKYDTNRMGSFRKTITVYSNAKNGTIQLVIKGTVVNKKKDLNR